MTEEAKEIALESADDADTESLGSLFADQESVTETKRSGSGVACMLQSGFPGTVLALVCSFLSVRAPPFASVCTSFAAAARSPHAWSSKLALPRVAVSNPSLKNIVQSGVVRLSLTCAFRPAFGTLPLLTQLGDRLIRLTIPEFKSFTMNDSELVALEPCRALCALDIAGLEAQAPTVWTRFAVLKLPLTELGFRTATRGCLDAMGGLPLQHLSVHCKQAGALNQILVYAGLRMRLTSVRVRALNADGLAALAKMAGLSRVHFAAPASADHKERDAKQSLFSVGSVLSDLRRLSPQVRHIVAEAETDSDGTGRAFTQLSVAFAQ